MTGDDAMLIWGLALLAAAVLLVVVEVLVPSGGLIGVLSAGLAIAGCVFLFRYSTTWGLAGSLFVIVGGPALFVFALNMLPSTPTGRAMLGEINPEKRAEAEQKEREERERFASLVGAEGEALTDLRPVGTVQVEGERHEATADTSYIRVGEKVRVTGVDMTTLKVRPVDDA